MSNRSCVSLLVLAFVCLPSVAGASARAPVQVRPVATPAPAARPVCGLEGEIGEGRGRIVARGADGYRGEMTVPLARDPAVVLKVVSDFVPHRSAVDRITLEIGEADAVATSTRLTGAFGTLEGRSFIAARPDRGLGPAGPETAWFEALLAGQTLTAVDGAASASVVYPARRFEDDYDYLLDLLQLVAGWEVAGLCVNRSGG